MSVLRIYARPLFFTAKNTGLTDKGKKKFPLLGAAWKAAHIKVVLWHMSEKAKELASNCNDAWLKAITRLSRVWNVWS